MKLISHPWNWRSNPLPPGTQPQNDADKLLPCAQPMDPLTKHLFWAFGIIVAAVVLAVNMAPQTPAPLACSTATTIEK